jgi:hypothetical protein
MVFFLVDCDMAVHRGRHSEEKQNSLAQRTYYFDDGASLALEPSALKAREVRLGFTSRLQDARRRCAGVIYHGSPVQRYVLCSIDTE